MFGLKLSSPAVVNTEHSLLNLCSLNPRHAVVFSYLKSNLNNRTHEQIFSLESGTRVMEHLLYRPDVKQPNR